MESLDTLAGLADDANPVSAHLASEGAAALSVEKKLDLVIWYMREVHAHCYYTSTKLWWPWQAQRRPPAPEPPLPPGPAPPPPADDVATTLVEVPPRRRVVHTESDLVPRFGRAVVARGRENVILGCGGS